MLMFFGFTQALSLEQFTLPSAAFLASVVMVGVSVAYRAETVAHGFAVFLMNPINVFVASVSFWDVAGPWYAMATVGIIAFTYVAIYIATDSLRQSKKAQAEGDRTRMPVGGGL